MLDTYFSLLGRDVNRITVRCRLLTWLEFLQNCTDEGNHGKNYLANSGALDQNCGGI